MDFCDFEKHKHVRHFHLTWFLFHFFTSFKVLPFHFQIDTHENIIFLHRNWGEKEIFIIYLHLTNANSWLWFLSTRNGLSVWVNQHREHNLRTTTLPIGFIFFYCINAHFARSILTVKSCCFYFEQIKF